MNDLMLIPKPRQNILVQEVDNEVLIFDKKDNKIHQLNETASFIWEKCDGINSIDVIVSELVSDFNISLEEAEKDVLNTLSLFRENHLLDF